LILLAAGPEIHTDFEGGSLAKVDKLGENHFRCALKGEADQDGRNRQITWYYFRLDGAAGREVTLDFTDLVGEYNYRTGARAIDEKTPGVYSYDQKSWRHLDRSAWREGENQSIRLRFTPERNRAWIAHVPPYTTEHLRVLLRDAAAHRHAKGEVAGKTVGGRGLPLLTITNPAIPDASKKAVWLMFRQHSWESGTSWSGEGAIRWLLSADPAAVRIRDEFVFRIFPMADPDGVARGGVRFNAHGYDLNRNWDVTDPKLMPEITAQRKAVFGWLESGRRIDLFFTMHNTETGEYIDGPLEGEHGTMVARLYETLNKQTTFNPTRPPRDLGVSTTPGKPGRMNVCQGLYQQKRIPCVLMEQMIAFNDKLGRQPAIDDRMRFGGQLIRAIAAALRN
jgi:hypothetical protein